MDNRIIYTQDEGLSVSVIHPCPGFTIEQCVKDIPYGAKYKFIPAGEIPMDRTFRDAWEVTIDGTWSLKG